MSEQKQYPKAWAGHDQDFVPGGAIMDLKGRDYLNVQNRLRWFVRDQRALIVAGVATTSYVIRADLVEHDPERGYAQYSCYVRDVLGNECVMFGSETAKDFGDYREKASTKALGRALIGLGYSTGAASEIDEGDRPVDAPQERRQQQQHAPSRDVPRKLPEKMAPFPQAVAVVNPADDPAPNEGSLTLADFLKTCRQELDLAPPQVMEKLGVKSLTGLNLDQALAQVRADLRSTAPSHVRP